MIEIQSFLQFLLLISSLAWNDLFFVGTVNAFASTSIYADNHRQRILVVAKSAPKIIFSDIDGSLVHYESQTSQSEDTISSNDEKKENDDETNNLILALPPSATGMRGVISSKTLAQCRDLRNQRVVLVLISGMRTSTLLNRLPYLPKADVYCAESGGRIFYPTSVSEADFFQYQPLEYNGADLLSDLQPFGLREDETWRQQMEHSGAGSAGFVGNELDSSRCDESDDVECLIDYENTFGFPEEEVPLEDRTGILWEFARELQLQGFVLDTKSYSTCFRVNKKLQKGEAMQDKFQLLLNGDIDLPLELDKSTNLGCIDIYPRTSGKRNCCEFLAQKFGVDMASESVCIVDDDNDVEMAMACAQAYVPSATSTTMAETMQQYPNKFTQTFSKDVVVSTAATEAALQLILDRVI